MKKDYYDIKSEYEHYVVLPLETIISLIEEGKIEIIEGPTFVEGGKAEYIFKFKN